MTMEQFRKVFHRNPAERALWEKIARRFILPPHSPFALPMGSWGKREAKLKSWFPIRYFVWDTLPDFWRYKIARRWRDGRYWIRYRTTDKYHVVNTGLSPNYYDPDIRMLHVNFQILKDFVEIELASMNSAMSDKDEDEDISKGLRRFGKLLRWRRRKQIRDPKGGLEHLEWEINETSGHQQSNALEKKTLYLWWTDIRPNRAESLSTPLVWANKEDEEGLAGVLKGTNSHLYKMSHKLDEFYEREDDEMLERLMRVRKSLWT